VNTPVDAQGDPALQRLVDRIRAANAERTPLCIRGGGTKDFYGNLPAGTPLDVGELRGICSYEPTEMVITARAGTPLAELESVLAEHGQCLAFEPPRFGAGGTVGGMIAAGLAGPARATAGSVRDFLLGATVLNGRGELLQFGGQVMKNVAGYDVSRVLAGSMGILGVICEVSIKVPPVAPARATLVFSFGQAEALQQLQRWAASAVPLTASAWQGGMLHLRLAGARAAVHASAERLSGEFGATRMEPDAADAFWQALRDQRAPFFANATGGDAAGPGPERALWRLSVPPSSPPLSLADEPLIEWGGAQRWIASAAPAEQLRECAARAGGHASRIRSARRDGDFLAPLPPVLERIHRALKQSFDPAGIFNPGRLVAGL
jgi:glycolate oxidase FAD binding subunit